MADLEGALTPIGAERAGNQAGTIPAYSGGLTADFALPCFQPGQRLLPDPYVSAARTREEGIALDNVVPVCLSPFLKLAMRQCGIIFLVCPDS